MRRADRSGIDGEERGGSGLDVGQVDTGVGADEAVAGLGDEQVAAAPHDANGLRLHQCLLGSRVVGVDGHDPALGLGDHLLGHDHDVARRPGRRGRPAGHRPTGTSSAASREARSSPARTSPIPTTGKTVSPPAPDRPARISATASRTVRDSAAERSTRGHDGRGHQAADSFGLDGAGQCRVGFVDDQGAHPRGVPTGHPDHRGLEAHLPEQPVRRALQGGAGDDRRDADDPVASVRELLGDARHGQQRADGDHRVGRAHHDDVGRPQGLEDPRPRPGRLGPLESDPGHRARRGAAGRSTPESPPRARPPAAGGCGADRR